MICIKKIQAPHLLALPLLGSICGVCIAVESLTAHLPKPILTHPHCYSKEQMPLVTNICVLETMYSVYTRISNQNILLYLTRECTF